MPRIAVRMHYTASTLRLYPAIAWDAQSPEEAQLVHPHIYRTEEPAYISRPHPSYFLLCNRQRQLPQRRNSTQKPRSYLFCLSVYAAQRRVDLTQPILRQPVRALCIPSEHLERQVSNIPFHEKIYQIRLRSTVSNSECERGSGNLQ